MGTGHHIIPRSIILRYSQERDLVLNQFADGGTTLIEAKLLNRDIIGVDCNDEALKRRVFLYKGNARNLWFQSDNSVDLDGVPGNLSLLKVKDFLGSNETCCRRKLSGFEKGKILCVTYGRYPQKDCMIHMNFDVMKIFQNKEQHNCKATSLPFLYKTADYAVFQIRNRVHSI